MKITDSLSDAHVRNGVFANRSRGVEEAVAEKLDGLASRRLAQQCAKLDPDFEQSMAEEGMSLDAAEWPEYSVMATGQKGTPCASIPHLPRDATG